MKADLSKLLNSLTVGSVAGLFLVAFAVSASGAGMLSNPLDSGETATVSAESASDYTGYVSVEHQRDVDGDGEYETVDTYKGHNLITNQGLEFFKFQASGVAAPDSNYDGGSDVAATSGDTATFISVSDINDFDGDSNDEDSTSSVTDAKTYESLQGEITSGNLSRTGSAADGTYDSSNEVRLASVADNGGQVGSYAVEYTYTASSNFDTKPIEWTGLHWTGESGNDDLVAYNHFPGVTMLADDKLTISWTEVSFSEA